MAFSNIYVDPSIAGDSGTGTVGDPFGDLEYGIIQTTFDTVNGTQVNTKAGTDEILAAVLQTALADTSVTAAWGPTEVAPCIFRGYTTTADDGGIGGISGGGLISIMNGAALDFIHFIDMHLHNCGSASVIDIDNSCTLIRCEIDNTTGHGIRVDSSSLVSNCHIHNIGNVGINISNGIVEYCLMENGTNDFSIAIDLDGGTAYRNIIKIDGDSDGIIAVDACLCINNSIWSNGGTGEGIRSGSNTFIISITNNLIEGFSGTGGVGIEVSTSGTNIREYGGNAVYDCATNYATLSGYLLYDLGDNETLSASPFTDATNGDFSPVDTGNVKEGSLPDVIGLTS